MVRKKQSEPKQLGAASGDDGKQLLDEPVVSSKCSPLKKAGKKKTKKTAATAYYSKETPDTFDISNCAAWELLPFFETVSKGQKILLSSHLDNDAVAGIGPARQQAPDEVSAEVYGLLIVMMLAVPHH
jgi:hypothetical protein